MSINLSQQRPGSQNTEIRLIAKHIHGIVREEEKNSWARYRDHSQLLLRNAMKTTTGRAPPQSNKNPLNARTVVCLYVLANYVLYFRQFHTIRETLKTTTENT